MKAIRLMILAGFVMLVAFMGICSADTGVPAVPEVQGFTTGTTADVVGTVTETDSVSWTLTNDPFVQVQVAVPPGEEELFDFEFALFQTFLQSMGGSLAGVPSAHAGFVNVTSYTTPAPVDDPDDYFHLFPGTVVSQNAVQGNALNVGQVRYTSGYNDQYTGVSGRQNLVKSTVISTANKIADQDNIRAGTSIQFDATDGGRATRSEELLIDGAAQSQGSSDAILCPFGQEEWGVLPAFCTIVQAGSEFDSTLTSTVTSTGTRFVGTDPTIPVLLDYTINAKGPGAGDQASPMIGSASAYLNAHVQEARNESVLSGTLAGTVVDEDFIVDYYASYSLGQRLKPEKSEDLTYSERSTASGLISSFGKSMSYSSQASAVRRPDSELLLIAHSHEIGD